MYCREISVGPGIAAISIPAIAIGRKRGQSMAQNSRIEIGYKLTSEEFAARELVRLRACG